MELTIYEIIKRPIVTDKASQLARGKKQITFEVHPKANKPLIAYAVEKLFNVEVAAVKITVRKGKNRLFKRIKSQGNLEKRAIIILKPGYSLGTEGNIVSEEMPVRDTKE